MTPNFITQYHPLTARPFLRNNTYKEYIPCKQLRPYVTCFWSSEGIEKSGADGLIRVIPDTCMDIIIDINDTKQLIKSRLCGIQDYAVMVEQGKEKEETVRFAVRFPFWAVRRFLDLDMSGLYNQTVDLDLLIPGAMMHLKNCSTAAALKIGSHGWKPTCWASLSGSTACIRPRRSRRRWSEDNFDYPIHFSALKLGRRL